MVKKQELNLILEEYNRIKKELIAYSKSKGKLKKAKGFSKEELKEVGLSLKEALKLRIPVDKRRKTKYDFNVEKLKKIDFRNLKNLIQKIPKKKINKKALAKKHKKRVFRGLTSAGIKIRGLRKLKLIETHKHKWKKKQKEKK